MLGLNVVYKANFESFFGRIYQNHIQAAATDASRLLIFTAIQIENLKVISMIFRPEVETAWSENRCSAALKTVLSN